MSVTFTESESEMDPCKGNPLYMLPAVKSKCFPNLYPVEQASGNSKTKYIIIAVVFVILIILFSLFLWKGKQFIYSKVE